jgi:hypothetical protein
MNSVQTSVACTNVGTELGIQTIVYVYMFILCNIGHISPSVHLKVSSPKLLSRFLKEFGVRYVYANSY